jgi:arylsulfatase A-like enzyme
LHIADYQALLDAADKELDDRYLNFVLLHLPIPHPGGIYNRAAGEFALKHSSYVDNLALTDKCLAHLRARLEESQEWDSSTIVIMGDHSWRTKLAWRASPDWSKEDEIASQGGRFDDRPAYIVKLPQQRVGRRIEEPFAALNTRKLLDALLTQNIRSPEDLSVWAQQSR